MTPSGIEPALVAHCLNKLLGHRMSPPPPVNVGHIGDYVDATVKTDSRLCKSFRGNRFTVSRAFTVFNWKYDGEVNMSTGQPSIKSM